MQENPVEKIMSYLYNLDPTFFSTYMVGAKKEEIEALEAVAKVKLSQNHRTFLQIVGGTKPYKLNPFFCNYIFYIPRLIKAYEWFEDEGLFPTNVVLLATSDTLENMYLLNGDTIDQDPWVGGFTGSYVEFNDQEECIRKEDSEFIITEPGTFTSYLLKSAFTFRLTQFEYELGLDPPLNREKGIFEGDPKTTLTLLSRLGFQKPFPFMDDPFFQLCEQIFERDDAAAFVKESKFRDDCFSLCFDRGDAAAIIYYDGGGCIVGHNKKELAHILQVLTIHLNPKMRYSLTGNNIFRDTKKGI